MEYKYLNQFIGQPLYRKCLMNLAFFWLKAAAPDPRNGSLFFLSFFLFFCIDLWDFSAKLVLVTSNELKIYWTFPKWKIFPLLLSTIKPSFLKIEKCVPYLQSLKDFSLLYHIFETCHCSNLNSQIVYFPYFSPGNNIIS